MTCPALARLHHILEAIDDVAGFLSGMDLAAYQADLRTRRAVERSIEIVSEASRHIPDEKKRRFPSVPWSEIAGIGNVLRHEYQRVADPIIWHTASQSLPELRPLIVALIAHIEADSAD